MKYQRIAGNRQDFIEHEEGQQIRGHRDAHRRTDAERERRKITGLHSFMVVPHITDTVKINRYPQHGSQCRKNHTCRINPHREPNCIRQMKERVLVCHTVQHAADHADNYAEHRDGADGTPCFTDIRILIAHGDKKRRQKSDSDCNKWTCVYNCHFISTSGNPTLTISVTNTLLYMPRKRIASLWSKKARL